MIAAIRALVAAACLAAAGITAGPPAAAQTQSCADVPGDPRLPPPGDGFRAVQMAVAAALGEATPLLDDGLPGPVSSRALVDLCTAVPVAGDQTPFEATSDLVVEYAALTDAAPGWLEDLRGWGGGAGPLGDPGTGRLALRLAGPVAMTAAAITGAGETADCTGLGAADLPDGAAAGLAALAAADPALGGAAPLGGVCAALPVQGGPPAVVAALARFGALEAALPGAVRTLLDPAFAAWLAEAPLGRLRRLVGTPGAVLALLRDYPGTGPDTDAPVDPPTAAGPDAAPGPAALPLPPSCRPEADALTYTAFTAADAEALTEARQVRPPLQALTETFDSSAALVEAIFAALGPNLTPCIRDRIRQLALDPESAAQVFLLDAPGVQSLAFDADLATAQPVVEALLDRRAPSREALLEGAEAAIRSAVEAEVAAEVALAADTVAAAAEPLPPIFDLQVDGVPDFDIEELPPMIVVTELTDQTLAATLDNEAFLAAIAEAEFQPAPNAETLRGDVRQVLADTAAAQVDERVSAAVTPLSTLVDQKFAVTPALVEGIAGIEQLVESFAVPPEAVAQVVGLSYPNRRLMEQAFRATDAPPDPAAFARAMELAVKRIDDTVSPRATGDFASDECGCVSRRQSNSLVYAFYPFWLSPILPDRETAAAAAAQAAASGEPPPPPPTPQPIDYVLTDRVAFYGLELRRPEAGGVPALRFAHHWERMKEDFIASAHRHRARVDVTVTLRGWEDWTDTELPEAAAAILSLADPYDRFEDLSFATLRQDLPTLFDAPRADGITLIFEGYDGMGTHPDADRLMALVDLVGLGAADRRLDLFLALDPPVISDNMTAGLMDDLEPLLGAGDDPFTSILLFLERPTTDAKKIVRFRMENGVYRGSVRRDLLRKLVPVVPPGGHAAVAAEGVTGPEARFSQLRDDLVYFQDNFGGVGIWPTPALAAPEEVEMSQLTMAQFDRWRFFDRLSHWEERLATICMVVCPNRIYFGAAATLVALITAVLVVRSVYTGVANRIAFRMGFAWIGAALLLGLLFLLTVCDQHADVAMWMFYAFLAFLAAALVFNTYQAAQSGPKP